MATTIVNSCTPDSGQINRGRRKLDFTESQRFKGKRFFLDLNGYRRASNLASELIARGASVEKFLDKTVRYLITNKPHAAIDNAKRNISSNPTTPSTGGLSQVFSPFSQSPYLDKKSPQPYYFTRSQKIMQMSKEKDVQSGKLDILTMAARWNCKIIHVDAVEKELKKLKPLTTKKTIEYKRPNPKYVRKLRQPFFKIEDKSRQYRPIIYETNNWPSPNTNCSFKQSPFDVNCHKDADQDSVGVNSSNSDVEGDNIGEDDALYEDEKRPGFCEPCSVRYEDLKTHLVSDVHEKYANDEKNFAKLDELMAQCTSLNDFIAETIRFSRASITPERCLGSPIAGSPLIREPQLSLTKIASPISLSQLPSNRKRIGSLVESHDLSSKRTKLNL